MERFSVNRFDDTRRRQCVPAIADGEGRELDILFPSLVPSRGTLRQVAARDRASLEYFADRNEDDRVPTEPRELPIAGIGLGAYGVIVFADPHHAGFALSRRLFDPPYARCFDAEARRVGRRGRRGHDVHVSIKEHGDAPWEWTAVLVSRKSVVQHRGELRLGVEYDGDRANHPSLRGPHRRSEDQSRSIVIKRARLKSGHAVSLGAGGRQRFGDPRFIDRLALQISRSAVENVAALARRSASTSDVYPDRSVTSSASNTRSSGTMTWPRQFGPA